MATQCKSKGGGVNSCKEIKGVGQKNKNKRRIFTIASFQLCDLHEYAHRAGFMWLLQKENDSGSPTKLLSYIGSS